MKCYDLLSEAETPRYIGGIENQLVLLARGLVKREFAVSFVTYDHGQRDGIEHHGIRVYRAYDRAGGIPGVRFLHPRWTGLCAALARAGADIYYQMGAGCETGQVALWCRRRQRRFVFAVASDADCLAGLPSLKSRRERCLFRYGLRHAGPVIAQTHRQCRLLQTHYGVSARVIRTFTDLPQSQGSARAPGRATGRRRVLWLGRICPAKRPHLLLELARRLPEYTLDVVGEANAESPYARTFRQNAGHCPSLVLHGRVSQERLRQMYDETAVLLGTSQTEGFPVVFLEAWSRGIPVLSTFDPDGVIAGHHVGWYASSVAGLAHGLRVALEDPEQWHAASEAARAYYARNHTADAALTHFEQLFLTLARGPESGNPAAR